MTPLTQPGEMSCFLSSCFVMLESFGHNGLSLVEIQSSSLSRPLTDCDEEGKTTSGTFGAVMNRCTAPHLIENKHVFPRVDLEPACTQRSRKHTSVLKSRIDCSWLWTKVDDVRSALMLKAKTWWDCIKPLVAVISLHVLVPVPPFPISVALISHMIISEMSQLGAGQWF